MKQEINPMMLIGAVIGIMLFIGVIVWMTMAPKAEQHLDKAGHEALVSAKKKRDGN